MTEPAMQPKSMSELNRLVGVFWEPRPVFENLAAQPRWWVPLILITVLSLGYVIAFSKVVGWETLMRQQMDSNPRLQQLTPEQRAQAMEAQMKFAPIMGTVAAAVMPTLSALAIGAVLLGVFNFLGGASLKFKQAFSIAAYASLPGVLATILALIVMFLKNPADFDLQNPLFLNVGAFLDAQSTPKWLHSFATSLDLFSFWVMLLLAVGFTAAARKMKLSKAFILVLLPWAAYVIVKSGLAGVFG